MTTRRELLKIGAAAVAAPFTNVHAAGAAAPPSPTRVRLAVSTYSYWHFRAPKYPVEKKMLFTQVAIKGVLCVATKK